MPGATLAGLRDCVGALEFIGTIRAPADSPGTIPARAIAAFAAGLADRGGHDGIAAALRLVAVRGDRSHPPALMARVERRLRPWLAEFDAAAAAYDAAPSDMVPLEWMADLIDFQQPWLDGHSRRVAAAALKALTLRLI